MTLFKGCIDIHNGQVKQIVGASLSSDKDSDSAKTVTTNFVSEKGAAYYGNLYREHNVVGTHVIKLGSSETNSIAAKEALAAWPGHLQIGGGINDTNAKEWIEFGALKVIVTSWLFPEGKFSLERLRSLSRLVGPEKIVLDLSCKTKASAGLVEWFVAINKWTTLTDLKLSEELFCDLLKYCLEFLIHAADVEGLCRGIDEKLVEQLGKWFRNDKLKNHVVVYAGGAKSVKDLETVAQLSGGKVDLTFGSALDIFGGSLVKFDDCVSWNSSQS